MWSHNGSVFWKAVRVWLDVCEDQPHVPVLLCAWLHRDSLSGTQIDQHLKQYIYRISNELSFITKFITWVGKHDIMRGSAEHNIIFANECNKFSNKWQRIWDFIYYITVKTIGISIFQL